MIGYGNPRPMPFTSMSVDSVTVCVTTYHRPAYLLRCLESIWVAGFRRVAVAAPEIDEGSKTIIEATRGKEWASFDVATTTEDIGCNNTWLLAAYRARTKRILLLHDDDELHPDLGKVYEEVIEPCLDKRDAGFASWDAATKYDDGRTEPCPYWQGSRNLVIPSKQFEKAILGAGNLTHSPTVSVFNRKILIHAVKEAAEKLITNVSIERPGMTFGSELMVYLRHCQAFQRWLHIPQVLSYYGHHEGSGTVKAQAEDRVGDLIRGYELARNHSRLPAPIPTPRILLVHSVYTPKDADIAAKQKRAQESWAWHFNNSDVIDLPYEAPSMPKVSTVFDYACQFAMPEDIIAYVNADAGLTTHAAERILAGIDKGRGVTSCGNRAINPTDGRMYKNLTNLKTPGGTELVAFTPSWWRMHRDKMPDMFIGREAWDTCFNALAEDWADGPGPVITDPDLWHQSRAHTDNVCWHKDHFSEWQADRLGLRSGEVPESQRHNRQMAVDFFRNRGDAKLLEMLK